MKTLTQALCVIVLAGCYPDEVIYEKAWEGAQEAADLAAADEPVDEPVDEPADEPVAPTESISTPPPCTPESCEDHCLARSIPHQCGLGFKKPSAVYLVIVNDAGKICYHNQPSVCEASSGAERLDPDPSATGRPRSPPPYVSTCPSSSPESKCYGSEADKMCQVALRDPLAYCVQENCSDSDGNVVGTYGVCKWGSIECDKENPLDCTP